MAFYFCPVQDAVFRLPVPFPLPVLKVTQASGVVPIFAAQANSDSPPSHLLWMRMQCNAFSTLYVL